jgi:hypothetical protein
MILLFGAPRSGTSWLGKIFDSHPDTLYRNEPDSVDRGNWPYIASPADAPAAAEHLKRLIRCNRLKPAGTRPILRKSYLSDPQRFTRAAIIYSGKVLERVAPKIADGWRVPDFVNPLAVRVVIKSVALGRAGAFAAAAPEARCILLIRHPSAHVASVLRGMASSRLDDKVFLKFVDTDPGRSYGLTREGLRRESLPVQLAWRWAVLNTLALEQMPGAKIIRFEELCADPLGCARAIFAFCDLSWSAETEQFLAWSTARDGGYFQTRRRPLAATSAWRGRFPQAEQAFKLIADTPAGALFRDHEPIEQSPEASSAYRHIAL